MLVEVQELASLVAARCVDQLEHEWPMCHDALPTRENVVPDNAVNKVSESADNAHRSLCVAQVRSIDANRIGPRW